MKIDPVIFTIPGLNLPIRWYSVLVIAGCITAILLARWYVKRRGEDPEIVSDATIWIALSGFLGARLWYVIADIIGKGGSSEYVKVPFEIIRVDHGGLNILGGILFAAVAMIIFTKIKGYSFWLIADAFGPGYLLGQAIGRPGNYINQELYGPPTELPWGIKIDQEHRYGTPWTNMEKFPVETTKFHPSFAYEMIWNIIFAAVILFIIIKFGKKYKNGFIVGLTLIVIGIGRTIMEIFFRPDQPRFFGTPVSTSMIISIIFLLFGILLILVKTGIFSIPFLEEEEKKKLPYPVRKKRKKKKKR